MSKIERPSWHEYFFKIAEEIKMRSTCHGGMVGCVFVNAERQTIISSGYNGSPRGLSHCDEVGCDRDELGHCRRTIHAEMNAIIQAARDGASLNNSVVYTTTFTCYNCFKTLVNVGVKKIYYISEYKPEKYFEENKKVRDYAKKLKIKILSKDKVLGLKERSV